MDRQPQNQAPGCLPIFAPVSAAQFVRLYAQHLRGVSIVGAAPVPPALQAAVARAVAKQRRNFAQSRIGRILSQRGASTEMTKTVASLRVESGARGERRDGLLTAVVACRVTSGGPVDNGDCSASMTYLATPAGKLGEMNRVVAGLPPIQWDHHWQAVEKSVTRREFVSIGQANQRQASQRLHNAAREDQARSIASHRAFMKQQATQYRNHEAFLGQMQQSTQRSMDNANAAMNARSTAASDTVDYSLDQQTVQGTNGTQKVSSAYSNAWSNGWGGTVQSNDPNANPNGVVKGNWTLDKKVHGNGQPW